MEINELTYSEKTTIISLIAREMSRLEEAGSSQDRIKELESIIIKLEKM